MNAEQAQNLIDALERWVPATEEQWKTIEHMKVDYYSLQDMPGYKRAKLQEAMEWIIARYDPPYIDLVMSQLNGHPVDEFTSEKDKHLKKLVYGTVKISDWDFIVPNIDGPQRIVKISKHIKIDMFKMHHNGVRKLRVYNAN